MSGKRILTKHIRLSSLCACELDNVWLVQLAATPAVMAAANTYPIKYITKPAGKSVVQMKRISYGKSIYQE